jgi:hypothetical protein
MSVKQTKIRSKDGRTWVRTDIDLTDPDPTDLAVVVHSLDRAAYNAKLAGKEKSNEVHRQNLKKKNDEKRIAANEHVKKKFDDWRSRMGSVVTSTNGVPWPIERVVRAYHKQHSKLLTEREKRRLNALVRSGKAT